MKLPSVPFSVYRIWEAALMYSFLPVCWACGKSLMHFLLLVLCCASRDITYSILFEAVTTLLVLLSYQLFSKEVLRYGYVYKCLLSGQW